jgi:hypothetical protein
MRADAALGGRRSRSSDEVRCVGMNRTGRLFFSSVDGWSLSGLDIIAWLVLLILAASVIGVFCIAGLAHVIRKVLLRQVAIISHINPF